MTMRAYLLGALLLSGCDFAVRPFAGSIIELSIAGIGETADAHHLELWARTGFDDVVRVDLLGATGQSYGLMVRKAITFQDPCMIDGEGHPLVSPDAYQTTHAGGVIQTPEQQAAQVLGRIGQVTSAGECTADGTVCGQQSQTLLAVLPYTTSTPPDLPTDLAPADRLAACQAYWSDPLAYTPNAAQLTSPLRGVLFGFVSYSSQAPPAGFDGSTLRSSRRLADMRELWLTDESVPLDQVSPLDGAVILDGERDRGGQGVLHFTLSSPLVGGPAGAAAVLVDLDRDDVQ